MKFILVESTSHVIAMYKTHFILGPSVVIQS